jgi:hypothetical protein
LECIHGVLNTIPLTTNAVERWHRGFNKKNEVKHPNIARSIRVLQEQEELNRISLIKAKSGNIETNSRNLVHEERLFILVKNYAFFEEMEYLEVFARCFNWDVFE